MSKAIKAKRVSLRQTRNGLKSKGYQATRAELRKIAESLARFHELKAEMVGGPNWQPWEQPRGILSKPPITTVACGHPVPGREHCGLPLPPSGECPCVAEAIRLAEAQKADQSALDEWRESMSGTLS